MALHFLERELRSMLAERGREELADTAVGSIGFTDDGETVYVHLLPKAGWPRRAQGRAFVLAWEDHAPPGFERMACFRWLAGEARTSMHESMDRIVRWLDGK